MSEVNKAITLQQAMTLYDDLRDRQEALVKSYEQLTFPVNKGTLCLVGKSLRIANQDIPTSEVYTPAHWEETDISEELTNVKNAIQGKYTKPSGGIPKTDLASDVQTSLGKADTALQANDVATAVDAWCDENITNPDSPPLDRSLTSSSAAAPADIVGELNSALNKVRSRTYNLLDSSASAWHPSNGKKVTISNPNADTVRVTSNISQTYAGAYCLVDVSNINTIYTSINSITGTGKNRSRLFTVSDNIPNTSLGAITKEGKTWDVTSYDKVAVVFEASTSTAGNGYIDFEKPLVADSAIEVPYVNYYIYTANVALAKTVALESDVDNLENSVAGIISTIGSTQGKLYVAHRGSRQTAPENTMPAFILAREQGFKYVETDIRFTSDGVAVLLHDTSINRTARNSDGSSISETVNIEDITYAQALTYDFGIYKGSEYAGTKIPTLNEFLKWCFIVGVIPVLEVKVRTVAGNATIIQCLQNSQLERFVILSYGTGVFDAIKAVFPDAICWYLRTAEITSEDITTVQGLTYPVTLVGDYTKMTDGILEAIQTAEIPLVLFDYTAFSDIYSSSNYLSGFIVEEGAI